MTARQPAPILLTPDLLFEDGTHHGTPSTPIWLIPEGGAPELEATALRGSYTARARES